MNKIILILIASIFIIGCNREESRVKEMIENLVSSMRANDLKKTSSFYDDGTIEPITLSGDSSSIYRMVTIPGGNNFILNDINVNLTGDKEAQATLQITAEVIREGKVQGTMLQNIKLLIEKNEYGEWKIISGSESRY
ncbi:MAG: hypothetical protein IPP08_02230 [Chlorobiota bacterium]|nr:MAG: hypothetical protein IPP08_02230 [Chlorobiota bacterium]